MENPYWTSDGQEHYVNVDTIKSLCFEICNIFEASRSLANGMHESEYADGEVAKMENFPLMALHQELAFIKSSELLLQLALLTRTYDDQMKSSNKSEEYKKFVRENDSDDSIGGLDGQDRLHLREACNKIIHAQVVRPLYERANQYVFDSDNSDLDQDIWYLTGEIELTGELKGKAWNADFFIQTFLENVLRLIQFGYPINESAANKANSAAS
jgi:hypothetical protein